MERGVAPGMALEKFARVAATLAVHLLVSDPVVPDHRFSPAILASWLARAQASVVSAEGDAASQLAEVGAQALASLVDAGDGSGAEDAEERRALSGSTDQ